MFSKCGWICVGLLLCVSDVYGDFDKDYYFGDGLRTNTKMGLQSCKNDVPAMICNLTCFENHVCIKAECLCLTDIRLNNNADVKSQVLTRPALRHHIAHFCPNLDDARVCIRACMKVGKPAFCGKDHQCYCGHKYVDPVKDTEMNAKEMYAQFKDLYTKYFGPGYSQVLNEDEDKDKDKE